MTHSYTDLVSIGLDSILTAGVLGILGYLLQNLKNFVSRQELDARFSTQQLQNKFILDELEKTLKELDRIKRDYLVL